MSKKNDEYKIELLSIAALTACNEFIESVFEDKDYEDFHWETKLRVIKVLKCNIKLSGRAQA